MSCFYLSTNNVCVCVFAYSLVQPNKKSENEAAIVIQSHIRGYFTRKQTHHDQLKQQQQQHHPYDMQHEESNIDQYRQPSIMTEVKKN